MVKNAQKTKHEDHGMLFVTILWLQRKKVSWGGDCFYAYGSVGVGATVRTMYEL